MRHAFERHKVHVYRPGRRQAVFAALTVMAVTLLHGWALSANSTILQAISLRIFYLPVIYAAVTSGMLLGTATGIVAAICHYVVMAVYARHSPEHHAMLSTEHFVEIPFLVILGAITGFFRDHERHERTQKSKIADQFGAYVSTEVRDDILRGNTQLGGNQVEVTILFADIRHFTSISEKYDAGEIVEMLNQYFSEMVRAITQHGGMVNKFIGDAVMAVFGAPNPLRNSAQSAVMAALEMQRRLEAHNFLQAAKNQPQFEIGIGLNAGTAIAGNIGSNDRKEYTVIGDTVNLASRVEALTKTYGVGILATASVLSKIEPESVRYREVDTVRVKGRSQYCSVYEIIDGSVARHCD